MDGSVVVFDNGSGTSRLGFAGHTEPVVEMPTIVGVPRSRLSPVQSVFVGDSALSKRGMLSLKHPVEEGVISNWEVMEKVSLHSPYCPLTSPPLPPLSLFSLLPPTTQHPLSCHTSYLTL